MPGRTGNNLFRMLTSECRILPITAVHADHLPVFPSEELHNHPHGATMAVVNVPLCEFTTENGAT